MVCQQDPCRPRPQIVGDSFDNTSQTGRKHFGTCEELDMKLPLTAGTSATGYSIHQRIGLTASIRIAVNF